MQELHRKGCRERRLLGGLREHRIARRERRAHLSAEDRERKIPRTDAGKDAAAAQTQGILLTGRTWQQRLGSKQQTRLLRVVAQEVDRFAHLRDAVRHGLARLEHAARNEFVAAPLKELSRTLENRG